MPETEEHKKLQGFFASSRAVLGPSSLRKERLRIEIYGMKFGMNKQIEEQTFGIKFGRNSLRKQTNDIIKDRKCKLTPEAALAKEDEVQLESTLGNAVL